MAVSFKIQGVGAAVKAVQGKIKNLEPQIQGEIDAWGLETIKLAKQFAPTDEGHLKGSINYSREKLKGSVTVAVNYAAYIEFGTRKFAAAHVATLPPDWQSFANEFKGKGGGGSFSEFVENIMEWVQRKGIGALKTKSGNNSTSSDSYAAMQSAAYAIALNIIQNGIKAHPYLYPATQITNPKLIDNIKNLLK